MAQSKPVVLALVICDTVRREDNGKHILVGTYTQWNSPQFPIKIGNMGVYCVLTSVPRSGDLSFLFRVDDVEHTFSTPLGPFHIENKGDRRGIIEIAANFQNLPVPREGSYELAVLWDGELLAQRRIDALKIVPPAA